MITLIWAQTKDCIIGKDNSLPWSIKEEMRHFIQYTSGKTILMGRKTWDSLKIKPLKNRKNYIVTNRQMNVSKYDDTYVVNNLQDFLEKHKNVNNEIVVIGGKMIYQQSIDFANKLVVSIIKKDYEGNVFLDSINYDNFKLVNKKNYDEFEVKIYERK